VLAEPSGVAPPPGVAPEVAFPLAEATGDGLAAPSVGDRITPAASAATSTTTTARTASAIGRVLVGPGVAGGVGDAAGVGVTGGVGVVIARSLRCAGRNAIRLGGWHAAQSLSD
jgi:hypothetical protein